MWAEQFQVHNFREQFNQQRSGIYNLGLIEDFLDLSHILLALPLFDYNVVYEGLLWVISLAQCDTTGRTPF